MCITHEHPFETDSDRYRAVLQALFRSCILNLSPPDSLLRYRPVPLKVTQAR